MNQEEEEEKREDKEEKREDEVDKPSLISRPRPPLFSTPPIPQRKRR